MSHPRLRDIVVAASAAALIAAPAAVGHSGVRSTTPRSGSTVQALPAKLTLTFGDRLLRVIGVQVIDAAGVDHATSSRLDPRNAARVVVATRRSGPGRYTVRWKVQSEDGHSEAGTFAFRVTPTR